MAQKNEIKKAIDACDINLDRLESELKRRKSYSFSPRESVGGVKIYFVLESDDLCWRAAEEYGEDRYKYVQTLLKGVADNTDRRPASKAPPKVFFEDLKLQFPNFNEAIEALDEARALSELTQSSWFQIPPLLLVGPWCR